MSEHPHTPHTHIAENGMLVKCYHHCKGVLAAPAFWIGVTVSYPFEHLLWERVPPFSWIAHYLGIF